LHSVGAETVLFGADGPGHGLGGKREKEFLMLPEFNVYLIKQL